MVKQKNNATLRYFFITFEFNNILTSFEVLSTISNDKKLHINEIINNPNIVPNSFVKFLIHIPEIIHRQISKYYATNRININSDDFLVKFLL